MAQSLPRQYFILNAEHRCYFEIQENGRNTRKDPRMPKKRAKKKTFSAVKAVKANARERVGQPKPERVIPDTAREEKRGQKHPKTLSQLLSQDE
jgi:hypothetical protein